MIRGELCIFKIVLYNHTKPVTLKRVWWTIKGFSESEPNAETGEPNEVELANNVSKIPGSLHCGVEDVNDWLNCNHDDPRYLIMTDDKIVGNLRVRK